MSGRRRVLFVAENVTLAQVVRLVTLAKALDRSAYEVHFACSRFDSLVFSGADFRLWPLYTVSPQRIEQALRRGQRLYSARTLRRYVEEDLKLYDAVEPHLIVGDFRQSLAISAPRARVPYVNLINAYWSPYAQRDSFPLPDHPIIGLLGEQLAAEYFPKAMPWVFDYFAKPVNTLRRQNGMDEIGGLEQVLTFGDYTVYPDVPGLVPTSQLPATHSYLGPVLWSPPGNVPRWWAELPDTAPTVYVTLGSSGNTDVLPTVLEALESLSVTVLLSTAGRAQLSRVPPNTRVASFLPGHLAARRSWMVISNGGSTTGYQALMEGTPVLGMPFNLDQHLAMQAIQRADAGLALPARSATAEQIRAAVALLLADERYQHGAQAVARELRQYDAGRRFGDIVRQATAEPWVPPSAVDHRGAERLPAVA